MPIAKLQPYRHSDKSINVSLYYLRAQIIREGLEGLAHVDALLQLRGLDPGAMRVPPKRKRVFRNGAFRRAVLDTLREGPKTEREIVEGFAEVLAHASQKDRLARVRRCLRWLGARGAVEQDFGPDGCLWRLAP